MTDAQIEAIARAYCVKLGLDPDEPALITGRSGYRAQDYKTQWAMQKPKVIAMREAIAEVLGNG
jgi:hypothetical protein